MKNTIKVKYLTDGNLILKLKRPLKIIIKYTTEENEDNGWEIDERKLNSGIYGLARTCGEVFTDYEEEFIFIWETYTKEADNKLTKDAQELKYWLLDIVEKEIFHK